MLKYCGYCKDLVENEGHTHPEKECNVCHQMKKIDEFPIHKSATDGHRHTCAVCIVEEKEKAKVRNAQYRREENQYRQQERIQRDQDNALLKAYGYRWRKEVVRYENIDEFYDEEEWILRNPQKEKITVKQAIEEIKLLQAHKPGHSSTLWAKDMLSRDNILILDTETTGFGDEDEIIEIAIADTKGRTLVNRLIKCQRSSIPQDAKAKHHINEMMLKENGVYFPRLWNTLAPRLEGQELIIYHADFDIRMLRQMVQRYGLQMPEFKTHCLMKYYSDYVGRASRSGNGYSSMSLEAACYHFQITRSNAHRALGDVQDCLQLLHGLASYSRNEKD
jgi:DNA polymerase-3 subunit epsilon